MNVRRGDAPLGLDVEEPCAWEVALTVEATAVVQVTASGRHDAMDRACAAVERAHVIEITEARAHHASRCE